MENIKKFVSKSKLLVVFFIIVAFAAAAVNFFVPDIFKSYAAALDPGHNADQVGSGTFSGSSTDEWNFPGKVTLGSANFMGAGQCQRSGENTESFNGVSGFYGARYYWDTDWIFVGLKNEGNDRKDGVILWADNDNTNAVGDDLRFLHSVVSESSAREYMRITRDGNVGIGTTNPGAAKLDVLNDNGNAIYGSTATASGVYGNGVYGVYGIGSDAGVFGNSDTSVGVYGNGPNFGVYGNSANIGVHGVGNNAGVNGYGNNYGVFAQGGINGVRSAGILYDFYAEGAGTDYGSSSSIRWKENVKPIDNALAKVLDLRGVYFDWKKEYGGKHGMGMVAEEVGKIIPEIVGYEENGIDATGMDYGRLTPVLVEAIKEQQKQIEELRNEIENLKAELNGR